MRTAGLGWWDRGLNPGVPQQCPGPFKGQLFLFLSLFITNKHYATYSCIRAAVELWQTNKIPAGLEHWSLLLDKELRLEKSAPVLQMKKVPDNDSVSHRVTQTLRLIGEHLCNCFLLHLLAECRRSHERELSEPQHLESSDPPCMIWL